MPEVTLEPHDGKTHFYLGEPIRLDMVFRNTTGTPMMLNTTDYGDMSDKVSITPADGWMQWSGQSNHDYASVQTLTDRAQRIPVRLNDGYVFRKPGHYTVRVTEQRVTGGTMGKSTPIPATLTNEVDIDLEEMPAGMEAESIREIRNDMANAPAGPQGNAARYAAMNRLSALQGDESMVEKVRMIVAGDETFRRFMSVAIVSTRNLPRQLELLEAAWRNPANPPRWDEPGAMSLTRRMIANLPLSGWQMAVMPRPLTEPEKKIADANRSDMEALLASMPQRTGESRMYAAYYLLEFPGLNEAELKQAHEYAVQEFPRMDWVMQGMLLQTAHPPLRDPQLVPSLLKTLQTKPADRETVIAALELTSGDEQKQVVINAICANGYPVLLDVIAAWHGDRLPEVDTCLAERLKTPEEGNIGSHWNGNAILAARYATPAILPQIKEGWKLPSQDGAMLAVLTRMAPAEAVTLMEKLSTQPDIQLYQTDAVLDSLHAPMPSEELAWLRMHLPAAPPQQKRSIAYQLSRHGEASDELLLEKQLIELRKQWADRATELNAAGWNTPLGATKATERDLIDDLFKATAWKLPPEKKQALAAGCLTDECRRYGGAPLVQ